MPWLKELFTQPGVAHTILIYGLVIAIGLIIGKYRFRGLTLGVTWILFAGLAASYLGITVNEETRHFLKEFGLVLFVYAIGMQVGPGFFEALKKNALSANILAALIVLLGVTITVALLRSSGFSVAVLTGIMSGAVTNTPGLGAAQSALTDMALNASDKSIITVAYALVYPFGIIGILISMLFLRKMLRINIEKEREKHRKLDTLRSAKPASVHLKLENPQLAGKTLRTLFSVLSEPVVISRMRHRGEIITPTPDQVLAEHDVLLIVASRQLLPRLKLLIGPETDENLTQDRVSNLISRHVVVTRSEVTHKRLGDIQELHQHDFTFTRLYRAGTEMVASGNMFLQLGDILKVVGTAEGVEEVSAVLGNQVKRLEAPDLAAIFIGIVLGVIVGSIPLMLPHIPVPVKIGLAGGPLLVALLLTRFGGRVYLNTYTTTSANMMLRELGIALFLASVGLGSGQQIGDAFAGGSAWLWILFGLLITIIPLVSIGLIAAKYWRKTYFEICGIVAGASTDPPALAFAVQMAGSDVPAVSYATVYPLTMILRIIAAQLLVFLFS